MGLFKGCFGCFSIEADSQPYETARATLSPVGPEVAVQPAGKKNEKPLTNDEPALLTHTLEVAVASEIPEIDGAANFLSLLEAQSFNPPLCSTKIGEALSARCSSLPAIDLSGSVKEDRPIAQSSSLGANPNQTKLCQMRRCVSISCELDVMIASRERIPV